MFIQPNTRTSTTLFFIVLAIVTLPFLAEAFSCNREGYTVVFVNGILTEQDSALESKINLTDLLPPERLGEKINVQLGYNPSHFAGLGDFAQSVAQVYDIPISNYDRDTILRQIHSEVTTRKILLVGHSQGTFYTNELYKYLIGNGVPKESIAIYNLATPASYVADGSNNYLTSGTDNVVNWARVKAAQVNAPPPLPSNIFLQVSPQEAADAWGGHSFSGVYLDRAAEKITSSIQSILGKLVASETANTDDCFDPPSETLSYKAQRAMFTVGDPASRVIKEGFVTVKDSAVAVTKTISSSMANTVKLLKEALMKLLPPRGGPSGSQTAAAASVLPPPSPPAVVKTNTPPTKAATPNTSPPSVPPPSPPAVQVQAPQTIPPPVLPVQSPPQQPQSPTFPALVPVIAGFGGGGGGSSSSASTEPTPAPAAEPVFVPLDIVSPLEGATFATTSVTFTGTTTAGFLVAGTEGVEATTTTADADGNWMLSFVLSEGENDLSFSADDGAGNMSDIATRTITVDTTAPPAPVLSIAECADSFSSDICMIATTTVTLVWAAVPDAAFYSVGEVASLSAASTTATSQEIDTLGDRVETTFYVNAYDALGWSVRSNAAVVLPFNLAVTINEVAWAGTATSSEDEWLELSNNTDYAIDLTRFTLVSADGGLTIPLSGSIAAHGYYLIERREEATDRPSDLVIAFEPLSDGGEQLLLMLEDGSELATFDLTPPVETCGGWCEGTGTAGEVVWINSMERVADIFGAVGSELSAWQTYGSTADHATDADGNLISGTPRAENSTEPMDFGLEF